MSMLPPYSKLFRGKLMITKKFINELPHTQRKIFGELAELVLQKSQKCEKAEHTHNVSVYKNGIMYISLCELCKRELSDHAKEEGKVLELIKVG